MSKEAELGEGGHNGVGVHESHKRTYVGGNQIQIG